MKRALNIYLMAGGLLFLSLIGSAAFLLVRGFSQLGESEQMLADRRAVLGRLFSSKPFPSAKNVVRERENAKQLETAFSKMLIELRKGQEKPAERSPSAFMSLLSAQRNSFVALSRKSSTALAPEMGFGFERYLASVAPPLPAPDHVPRLIQQLAIVDRMLAILFAEGASELIAVKREEFETAAVSGSTHGPRPLPSLARTQEDSDSIAKAGLMGPRDLYGKFRFVLEFKAKERALLGILNRVAAEPMFTVVRRLETSKEFPDVAEVSQPAKEEPPAPGQKPASPPVYMQQERMVSGLALEHPMKVVMELEVYRFREAEQGS